MTGARPTAVVDTNVLLNLATPVVDGRPAAPTGADPLLAVLSVYDVRVPATVLGEVADATGGDDRLAAAAEAVLRASGRLTTHEVEPATDDPVAVGLDPGEARGIRLANDLGAAMFVTDEFGSTNHLLVALGLDDRNTLFTTPHVLCLLGERGILPPEYVDAALSYYAGTKGWGRAYLDRLREEYLR